MYDDFPSVGILDAQQLGKQDKRKKMGGSNVVVEERDDMTHFQRFPVIIRMECSKWYRSAWTFLGRRGVVNSNWIMTKSWEGAAWRSKLRAET